LKAALTELWDIRGMFMKNVKALAILYSEAYKRRRVREVFYKSMMSGKELFLKAIGEDPQVAEKLKTLVYSETGPVDLFELTETLSQFEAETNEELRRKLKQAKEPLPDFLKPLIPGKHSATREKAAWRKKLKELSDYKRRKSEPSTDPLDYPQEKAAPRKR
jgi:hypothetical protein